MQSLKFSLSMEPITLNLTERNGNHRRYSTSKYKEFMKVFNLQVGKHNKGFRDIAKSYDPYRHFWIMSYIFHIPNLITKSGPNRGKISIKSKDLSNIEKPLEDQIFKKLKIYNEEIDDCQTCTCYKRKVYGDNYRIDVEVSIGDLNGKNN